MYKLYCRSFQRVMKVSTFFLPWREPQLVVGKNSLAGLPILIKREGIETILIVTDQGIVATGLMDSFLEGLRSEG